MALTLKAAGIEAEISQLSLKLVRHEGWMPRAGLPKPSRLAIGAGSVCVLDCDPAKVQQILAAGLGLRRAEGFGVVQINSPFVTAPLSANSHGEDCDRWEDDGKAHELNGNDQPYLKQVENTCVRERIRERAEILVSKVSWRKDNLGWSEGAPNMSQLGNLRAFMGRLESEADINAVSTYLRGVKPDWGGKVLALFENSPLIWEWLKGVQLLECAIVSTPEEIMTDKTFRRYAILCLLSAAMRAHKRGLEKLELENT
ncbi:MAG TPA: hypothetical protein ENJ90_03160 [Devosia sp.]|nr:hypothetical protein [Devosia sp.]